MKIIRQSLRLSYIQFILFRYGLYEAAFCIPWLYPLSIFKFINPFFWSYRKLSKGERIRLTLEKLGPIFVKFGQILSTRRDLFHEDIINELVKLQDQVPSFSGKKARKMVEAAFGKSIGDIYASFDENALASASIAQVHAATLDTGESVIVKVLRPKVKKVIHKDLELLYLIASLIERYWSEGKRLKPKAIVKEFEDTITNELDLLREASNASQLRRNFLNSELLYIPDIYWAYCKENVLTMERIYAMPVDDLKKLNEEGVDLKKLSERGVEIFFTQVFRDNFFHADMHAGNIFVANGKPNNPQYVGVDFGIMGSLSPEDKRYLAENFLAFFNRDYERVAKLHVESGWVPKGTRVDQFEGAIRAVCEPIFQRPLKDISFGQLLVRLFQTAGRFQMPVQPQLTLLQKTLLNVEGLGRTLNPDLDLWQTAKPFLENWIKGQVGPKAFFKRMRESAPYWIEKIPELPNIIDDIRELKCKEPIVVKPYRKRTFFFGASGGFLVSTLLLIIFTHQAMFAMIFLIIAIVSFVFGFLLES